MKKNISMVLILIIITLLIIYLFNSKTKIQTNSEKRIPEEALMKSETPENISNDEISEMDKDSIKVSINKIDILVKTLKTIDDVKLAIPTIESFENVEKVYIEGVDLYVKFTKGGVISYSLWSDKNTD